MNRKIKVYRAMTYIVIFYLAAACILLGPGGVLKKDRLVAGNEAPVGTAQVRQDQQIHQVFIAEGAYLKYLDLKVVSEASAWRVFRFRFYNDQNEPLINREITLNMTQSEFPGYWRIPLGVETEPGRIYFWQLQGTDKYLDLEYENTGETGLTSFGNYYILENGESRMQEAQNVIMRLTYTDSPSVKKMAVLYAALFLLAAVAIAFFEYAGRKQEKLSGKQADFRGKAGNGIRMWRLQTVVIITCAPVISAFLLYLLYEIFVRNRFGGALPDKAVYGIATCLTALFAGWVIFAKRKRKRTAPFRRMIREQGMDWLQTICFAGVFLGGIHYMNALYMIWQDLAAREILIWSGLLLLTMGRLQEIVRKKTAVWIVAAGLGGAGYYWYQSGRLTEEGALGQLTLRLYRQDILIFLIAGLVAIALYEKIRRLWTEAKAQGYSAAELLLRCLRRINAFYAALLAAFLVMLVIFSNTREWTVYLVCVFGLFYLFYLGWEKRDRLMHNFCNGIVLNFACACMFAFVRRPYRAWIYNRYNFVFHTVTITATYLTLVVCALTVRLLVKRREKKRLIELWGTLLLYGCALSFLFMTLSRTGYLAVIVMTAVVVPFVIFGCYRQSIAVFLKTAALMGVSALLCLPVVYTGVRLLPAMYADPYIFEVEESASAIYKEEPADSENYISLPHFWMVMKDKLLADAPPEREDAQELMLCMAHAMAHAMYGGEGVYIRPRTELVASGADAITGDDFSNGRFDIYRLYIREWNLTGHDQMGVLLPDGTMSVHAHNTYLQVIHDHGLLTGAVYLLLGLVSACLMFLYALRKIREDVYAALPLAVFVGFAVASLVEWLFHPCNPMGYAVMVVFAPLLLFTLSGKVRRNENDKPEKL